MRLIGLILLGLVSPAVALTVPAHTAYLEPDQGGARVSGRDGGVVRWKDSGTKVLWFGDIKQAGMLDVGVEVRATGSRKAKLKLKVGEEELVARASKDGVVAFGEVEIGEPGYVRFELERTAGEAVDVLGLELGGEAAEGAHFNLKERRNSASVHLAYPLPEGSKDVEAFYCEMTGLEDPLWTYYMACGWHRGYFGMQVNSPTERRIIFSVWDSGNEGIDRDKVAEEDRVVLMGKGDGVYSGSFGNEGTGGHSHLKFQWKTGERQRFLVTAEAVGERHTVFSGYYFRPDLKEWMLISSWKAPKEGRLLRGLYSFSENFAGRNGHVLRKARYGNQWVKPDGGEWVEVTRASFSHDVTGRADRFDRFGGTEEGEFFLSHGGFVAGSSKYGDPYERAATGKRPEGVEVLLPKGSE